MCFVGKKKSGGKRRRKVNKRKRKGRKSLKQITQALARVMGLYRAHDGYIMHVIEMLGEPVNPWYRACDGRTQGIYHEPLKI